MRPQCLRIIPQFDQLKSLFEHTKALSNDYIRTSSTATRLEMERNIEEMKKMSQKLEHEVIQLTEQVEWSKVIGTEVEVAPLPSYITSELKSDLEMMGLGIRYLPHIDLGTLDDLEQLRTDAFMDTLKSKFPAWEVTPRDDPKMYDTSKPRHIDHNYWDRVLDKKTPFPSLPGKWVAVETLPKPRQGKDYDMNDFGAILDLYPRHGLTYDDIQNAIKKRGGTLLSSINLHQGTIRLPELVEWNLLGNREGWGNTPSFEWTNTEVSSGLASQFVTGNSNIGGTGVVEIMVRAFGRRDVGYRLLIDFEE